MKPHKLDEITRTPNIRTPQGRAWRIDEEALQISLEGRLGGKPPHAGINASWLIEAPWAHPMWHSYWLTAMHLRPIEGLGEPAIYLAGATHEVVVQALNPDVSREPLANAEAPPSVLTPVNFMGQWIEEDDEVARTKIMGVVSEIMQGTLSPDTDFRQEWIKRFSDSNMKQGLSS